MLFILSIPLEFDRYQILPLRKFDNQTGSSYEFADINGDGNDDLVECGGKDGFGLKRNAFVVRSIDNHHLFTIDQINLKELPVSNRHIAVSNYDHDRYEEILVLSAHENRVHLLIFEGPDISEPVWEIDLDSLGRERDGKAVVNLSCRLERDINNDGYDEVFIWVSVGFPMYPRRLYRLDIYNREVLRGPVTSAGFNIDPQYCLHQNLFTGNSMSPDNHKDYMDLPYPDNYNYIYVLNEDLRLLFEPIRANDYPGICFNLLLNDFLYSLITSDSTGSIMQKRDVKSGQLIQERTLNFVARKMCVIDSAIALLTDQAVHFLDKDLTEFNSLTHKNLTFKLLKRDLNADGKPEFVNQSWLSGQAHVFSSELNDPVEFAVSDRRGISEFLLYDTRDNGREFVIHQDDQLHFYKYYHNQWYWLRWPYYLMIFGVSGLVSTFLFRRFQRNIEQRFEQERRLNQLQLLSIKNQVDPHFTLNALNSIDWMYRNNESQKASNFMGKLSRLMHQTVTDSDQFSISLYEELNFCRNFCELEKLRDTDFDYEIKVAEDLDAFEVEVPKQMIFTHVENAIKHGLRPKKGDKRLWIEVTASERGITIRVEDNGVGFQEQKETSGTRKGLKIMEEMAELYEKIRDSKVSYQLSSTGVKGTLFIIIIEYK